MTEDTYIVIGAGVFGSSTALELAKAGHRVIVLERSLDGYHAPDAASNDINKIVRADYFDEHYRDLGKEAISIWRRSSLLSSFYHETGVMFFARGASSSSKNTVRAGLTGALDKKQSTVARELPKHGQSLPPRAYLVSSKSDVARSFPTNMQDKLGRWVKDIESDSLHAYFNPRGGWCEANAATRAVLDEAKKYNVEVHGESTVVELVFEVAARPSKIIGVKTCNGEEYRTSGNGHVILCAGAWAKSFLQDLLPKELYFNKIPTWSSAQCVVALQLNEAQRKAYAGAPVILDFNSGFYCFEPDQDGVMKIAIHSKGYQNPLPPTSSNSPINFPSFSAGSESNSNKSRSTSLIPSDAEEYIPADKLESMMDLLGDIYPDLAKATVKYTRVCFYSDSEDENWIIDHVPDVKGLVVASGDSGHAFKFLPILGTLVCARLGLPSVSRLTAHQSKVFSISYHQSLLQSTRQEISKASEVENARFRL